MCYWRVIGVLLVCYWCVIVLLCYCVIGVLLADPAEPAELAKLTNEIILFNGYQIIFNTLINKSQII